MPKPQLPILTRLAMRRRSRPRPALLTERGQGLAVLLSALAVLFWVAARAKGLV